MSVNKIGERLRERRRRQGMTLKDVALAADLSVSYIANLERGRGNPTVDVLSRVAAALDMELNDVLGGEPPDTVGGSLPDSLAAFVKDDEFAARIEQMAEQLGRSPEEVRTEVVSSMVSAPRRSGGEPNLRDWERLLETFEYMSHRRERR